MIIDIIQHFKNDLTTQQCKEVPVYFLDVRTIRTVHVQNNVEPDTIFLAVDNKGFRFSALQGATDAARILIDLASEARDTERLSIASVNASQTGKTMKEIISEMDEK